MREPCKRCAEILRDFINEVHDGQTVLVDAASGGPKP